MYANAGTCVLCYTSILGECLLHPTFFEQVSIVRCCVGKTNRLPRFSCLCFSSPCKHTVNTGSFCSVWVCVHSGHLHEFISPCLHDSYYTHGNISPFLHYLFLFVKIDFVISYIHVCVCLCVEARSLGSLLSLSYRQLGTTRLELGTN